MNNAEALAKMLLGKLSGNISEESDILVDQRETPILNISMPDFDEDEVIETVKLSADPSKEELIKYARSLPNVRYALKIFRADIIDVKKVEK